MPIDDDDLRERYVRWEQLRIAQLSFTNNLLLGFTIAFIGFLTTNCKLELDSKYLVLQATAYTTLMISLISGVLLTYNRLKDFRQTTRLIYARRKKNKAEIIKLKTSTLIAGKWTWRYFTIQIGDCKLNCVNKN